MDLERYVCNLSMEEKLLAKIELNETDENRAVGIEEIRR